MDSIIVHKRKIEDFLDGAMYVSLCSLIFSLPASIALLEICAAFAIFFFVLKKISGIFFGDGLKWKPHFLNKPLLIFLFIILLSVFHTQDFGLSALAYLGKILAKVLLYFSIIETMTTKVRIKNFILVFLCSFSIVAINGMAQHYTGIDFIRGTQWSDGRISSCLRQANSFGTYLIFGCLLTFALGLLKQQKITYRVSIGLLFILSMVCLGFTYSRGAWLSVFLALIFWALIQKRLLRPLLVLMIFCVIFFPLLTHIRSDSLNMNGSGRMTFWQEAENMIHDHPILGVGLNNYSVVVPQYKEVQWGGYPHNSYLQMMAETGIFGLLSFLIILFVLFFHSLKNLGKTQDPFLQMLLSGLLAGLFGFLIESAFDSTLYSVQLVTLMWMMIGLIVAIQNRREI